jgi:two-component system phosphate regulon sensor histidine kinase PhoR
VLGRKQSTLWLTVIVAAVGAAILGGGLHFFAGGSSLPANSLQFTISLLCTLLAGSGLVLLQRWMSRSSLNALAAQIENLVTSDEPGLIPINDEDDLQGIVKQLNDYIAATVEQNKSIRTENRQLRIETRLAESEKQQIEAIIYSISDAVIVTNRFDELILANAAAEELFGFQCSHALRESIEKIVADAGFVQMIRETRNHGRRHSQRKVVEHTCDCNGETKAFKVTLSAVATGNDEIAGVVAVMHDMTREREIAKMKSEFVSNVSHELKTPLSSIKAYIEMLMDGEVDEPETCKEFYEIIASETDRLHRLIENILNISQIESGVVKVVREPMSLTGVVKQAVDVAMPQARLKHQRIEADLPPMYYQVEADHDMIYQAVLNLVSNAVKYTPENGAIKVNLSVDERRNVAICEVADTGVGIPEEALPNIFEKFYRVGKNSELAKGTGLGLTLVKHIVESVHHGQVSVQSEEGKGSRFSFELPLVA